MRAIANISWPPHTLLLALTMAGCSGAAPHAATPSHGHAVVAGAEARDFGTQPWAIDIEEDTLHNDHFRVARWTGSFLQMTLMSIDVGGEIGGEQHDDIDQFIRIEAGKARVIMGKGPQNLSFDQEVEDDWAVFIPAGYWHNVMNIGDVPLKIYSIYGPGEHPRGTLHETFEDSANDPHHHHH